MALITIKASKGDWEMTFPVARFVSITLIRNEASGQSALEISLAGEVKPNLLFFRDDAKAEAFRGQILNIVESKDSDGKHWELSWEDPYEAREEA